MPEEKPDATNVTPEQEPVTNEHRPNAETPEPSRPQPAPVSEPVADASVAKTSPGLLVLQWLVYAFWGWSLIAISWLTAIVMNYYFQVDGWRNNFDEIIPYSLASVIVLFIISLISDIFYSKHEPLRKTGAAMVIMVIHAVIFALFGIGWLIAAVFGGIRLLIGSGADGSEGAVALIATATLVSLLYGITLLRTLHLTGTLGILRGHWGFTGFVIFALIAAAVAGPAAQARLRQLDQPLEQGLPEVSRAINEYTERTQKLPTSLADIKSSLNDTARTIVDEDKVRYEPKERLDEAVAEPTAKDDGPQPAIARVTPDGPVYHYRLCVEYVSDTRDDDSYYAREYMSGGRYDTAPNTYGHGKGKTCYDLQTDYYSSYGY